MPRSTTPLCLWKRRGRTLPEEQSVTSRTCWWMGGVAHPQLGWKASPSACLGCCSQPVEWQSSPSRSTTDRLPLLGCLSLQNKYSAKYNPDTVRRVYVLAQWRHRYYPKHPPVITIQHGIVLRDPVTRVTGCSNKADPCPSDQYQVLHIGRECTLSASITQRYSVGLVCLKRIGVWMCVPGCIVMFWLVGEKGL